MKTKERASAHPPIQKDLILRIGCESLPFFFVILPQRVYFFRIVVRLKPLDVFPFFPPPPLRLLYNTPLSSWCLFLFIFLLFLFLFSPILCFIPAVTLPSQ
ncbi:Hypothetical protein, putative [Bodo saltans]|uniref:Transmembrane protein n=1 Tax=Bodo saltans TaxID=75058 RepID=A0A0S4IMP8_BODSA|nr:Hypothetical protein, putative [Bodo saltans]|eukprot:CUE73824.1 Hypothetical protein, putative [Bodo saltans]